MRSYLCSDARLREGSVISGGGREVIGGGGRVGWLSLQAASDEGREEFCSRELVLGLAALLLPPHGYLVVDAELPVARERVPPLQCHCQLT